MEQQPTFTFTVTQKLEGDYYNCKLVGNAANFICHISQSCKISGIKEHNHIIQFTPTQFDRCLTSTNKYVLRVYCQCPVTFKGKNIWGKEETYTTWVTVTEGFDCTLTTYFQQKRSAGQLTTPDWNRTTDDVGEVIRDIIKGTDQLMYECKLYHNMDPNLIHVIGKEVKYSGLSPLRSPPYTVQYNVFDCLKNLLGSNLTGELRDFSLLNPRCKREEFQFYGVHPGISNKRRRAALILMAYDTACLNRLVPGKEIEDLTSQPDFSWLLPLPNWKASINIPELQQLNSYKFGIVPTTVDPKPKDGFQSFATFMRAACHHCNDNNPQSPISIEVVHDEVDNAWRGFITLWFHLCLKMKKNSMQLVRFL